MNRKKKENKITKEDYKKIQEEIKESSLQDHAEWVHKCAEEMEQANGVGDTRKLYKVVKVLSGKVDKKPAVDLNMDDKGNAITSAEDRARTWFSFLSKKFAATQREMDRPEMPALPARSQNNKLTEEEVREAVRSLKNHKAVGADGIPVEVYKVSNPAFKMLFELLSQTWREEAVPDELGVAIFKMLYKRKGSPNDPSKYRCIGLLNSAYKVLSAVMLRRLVTETEGYLQDWQAGFRQERGCRDNVMILRTLVEQMLREGKPLVLTFIDYSAAFDSVAHKFLDKALGEAKAKPKTRAMFRAIYGSATAKTKVKDTDGRYVFSAPFPVRRGVIQGDITSPLYFIIALEAILRTYDNTAGKGVNFGGVNLHTLGYADDAALVDGSTTTACERVSKIAIGSAEAADMHINIGKTECMHVKRQQRVEAPGRDEAAKVCNHKCKRPGCGWIFGSKLGLRIHQAKWCQWSNYYEVEKILDHKCDVLPVGLGACKFLIKWKGYDHSHNRWIAYENVTKAAITEYLQANNIYDYGWQFRCQYCDKPCRSKQGVKVHYAAKCKKKDKDQGFYGTVAQRLHADAMMQERQGQEPKILCGVESLKNCYKFKYLGSMFTADGRDDVDIKRRIGMATSRCGQLRFILGAKNINFATKMKIYKCAVGSLFTYGSEAWCLNEKNLRTLNGANASCLQRFTNKTRIEESRQSSCTYSLCQDIRRRRLIWLGHILRMKSVPSEDRTGRADRLVKVAARVQHSMCKGGNLFMDAPQNVSFDDIVKMANDRERWERMVARKFGKIDDKGGRLVGTGADAVWISNAEAEAIFVASAPPFTPTNITTETNTNTNTNNSSNIENKDVPPHTPQTHSTKTPLASTIGATAQDAAGTSSKPELEASPPPLTLSSTSPTFIPWKEQAGLHLQETQSRAAEHKSELWAEPAPPPTPTPSSIYLHESTAISAHENTLWAEPARPPTPTPSSILLHFTPTPTKLTPPPNTSYTSLSPPC